MGFFQTIAAGYKIMFNEAKFAWQQHGAQILTGSGTGLMLIASGLMARKGMKEDTRKALEEANAVIAEIENTPISVPEGSTEKKEKQKKMFRLAKAKGMKFVKVGKKFWKEGCVAVAGAVAVGAGQHMNTVQKTALATAVTAVSAEFAAYRANVVADAGAEKDLEYLGQKKGVKAVKKGENGENGAADSVEGEENDGVNLKADPSAFKFWFSPETCPSLYSDNLIMTIKNLEWVENTLWRQGIMNGHLYLNDMRRMFPKDTTKPYMMDHPLGSVFGKMFDKNIPNGCAKFELGGWRDDVDFMEGRKVGTWIIFPCDKEPMIGKVNGKMLQMEDPVR